MEEITSVDIIRIVHGNLKLLQSISYFIFFTPPIQD